MSPSTLLSNNSYHTIGNYIKLYSNVKHKNIKGVMVKRDSVPCAHPVYIFRSATILWGNISGHRSWIYLLSWPLLHIACIKIELVFGMCTVNNAYQLVWDINIPVFSTSDTCITNTVNASLVFFFLKDLPRTWRKFFTNPHAHVFMFVRHECMCTVFTTYLLIIM